MMFQIYNHLEFQFESWMNWENWGKYNPKTWNDNDSSTWTWQIDHIKPRADFTLDEFDECWALSNLRPLRADINIKEGATRVRHNKNKHNKAL